MNSELFFNYPTCIDAAYIDNLGAIHGASFHPIIRVKGAVTEDESVVVDFSSGKKLMKEIIDHADGKIGFDHKLWIIPGYSGCEVSDIDNGHRVSIRCYNDMLIGLPATDIHVTSNQFNRDMVTTVEEDMRNILERELRKAGLHVTVSVTLLTKPFTTGHGQFETMFRYVHGLKDSTSYGCKNIAHGHLSFFEIIERTPAYRPNCQDCLFGESMLEDFFKRYESTIFINRENIVKEDQYYIFLKYTTGRGMMTMRVPKGRVHYEVLETETTIEYLAEWVFQQTVNYLHLAKVSKFAISEGLQKGVIVDVQEKIQSLEAA